MRVHTHVVRSCERLMSTCVRACEHVCVCMYMRMHARVNVCERACMRTHVHVHAFQVCAQECVLVYVLALRGSLASCSTIVTNIGCAADSRWPLLCHREAQMPARTWVHQHQHPMPWPLYRPMPCTHPCVHARTRPPERIGRSECINDGHLWRCEAKWCREDDVCTHLVLAIALSQQTLKKNPSSDAQGSGGG